jgi:Secretion system C-terminal sorting domain
MQLKIKIIPRLLLTVVALLCAIASAHAQTGYVWAQAIHGPDWFDYGLDATCDADGRVFLCGDFEGNVNFGGTMYGSLGRSDMYVCRLDGGGSFEWVNQQGSTATERNFSLHIGADSHIYSCGYGKVPYPAARNGEMHQWDAITTRIRPDGTVAWGRAMQGDIYSEAYDIAPDAAGNSYTVGQLKTNGWYGADTLVGHGLKDAFIVKFDSSGNFMWGKTFGGNSNDFANTVDVDAQGNVWVGGSFSGISHFDATTIVTTGKSDPYIAKLDPNGNVLFVKVFTGGNDAQVYELALSQDGDCYFTGDFAGTLSFPTQTLTAVDTSDLFYGKLDASGGFLWARQAGGFDLDLPQDLELDAAENIYIAGTYFGGFDWQTSTHPGVGYDHMFFAKTDSNGVLDFLEVSADTSAVDGFGIGVDPAQNVIVTGNFYGNADFGMTQLSSDSGTSDIFVLKYATRVQEMAITAVLGTPYCSNDYFQVVFQAWGNFPPSNVFTVELSDPSGGFSNPLTVGTFSGSIGDTISAIIPQTIVAGTHYRLRLRASQPALLSPDNGQDIILNPNTSIPVAILGDTLLCNGVPVGLSVDAGFVSQYWSTGDTSQAVSVTQPGVVWVEATDSNGCTNYDEVLVIACVGNAPHIETAFAQLRPNPASFETSLSIGPGNAGIYQLKIIDMQGRTCFARSASIAASAAVIPLDISALESGIYLVTVQNGDQQACLRLVVP